MKYKEKIKTKFLSEKERESGCKYLNMFEFFNGFALGYLGDTFVYILAVYFGASNFTLGYISSAMYVTYLLVPFALKFMNGLNVVKVMALFWFIRGIVCVFYILLLFLKGKVAISLIVVIYTLFCTCRAFTIMHYDFLQKTVTTLSNRGKCTAKINTMYNASILCTKTIASVLINLKFFAGLLGILILQGVGIISNIFSSICLLKVPCRTKIEAGNTSDIFKDIKNILKNKNLTEKLLPRWLVFADFVLLGMSVPFTKIELKLSSSLVMVFSVASALGLIISGLFCLALADKIGSKPLLQLGSTIVIVSSIAWCLLPIKTNFIIFFILGFFLNFGSQINYIITAKDVMDVIPEKERDAFNTILNVMTGLVSLITGILAGALVNFASTDFIKSHIFLPNNYSLLFASMMLLNIYLLFLTFKIKDKRSQKISMLFSFRGLKSIADVTKLDYAKPTERIRAIINLTEYTTDFGIKELRVKLLSPYSRETKQIMHTLADVRHDVFIPDLIRIAKNNDSFAQIDAIGALANYCDNPEVQKTLIYLLRNAKWSSAKAKAANSLSRIPNSKEYYDEVDALDKTANHIEVASDFLTAKYYMDDSYRVFSHIYDRLQENYSHFFRSTIYSIYDLLYTQKEIPHLARYLEMINAEEKFSSVMENLLIDYRDENDIDINFDSIIEASNQNNFNKIIDIFLSIVNNINPTENKSIQLKQGLLKINELRGKAEAWDIITLAYFCVLLLKS